MSFTYTGWRPDEELFEEVGVIYSWEPVDDFVAHRYTLIHIASGTRFSRTVYIMGTQIDTLLAHWNRGDGWKVER